MQHSGNIICIPEVPESTFLEAVSLAVGRNLHLVPEHKAYAANGSMYVRPLLFASGAQLALAPPSEFTFLVYVTPTGSLYGSAGGKAPAVDALVLHLFDRAAPLGTGSAKVSRDFQAHSLSSRLHSSCLNRHETIPLLSRTSFRIISLIHLVHTARRQLRTSPQASRTSEERWLRDHSPPRLENSFLHRRILDLELLSDQEGIFPIRHSYTRRTYFSFDPQECHDEEYRSDCGKFRVENRTESDSFRGGC